MTTYYQLHDSPTGELLLLSNGEALTALHNCGQVRARDQQRLGA